MSTATQDIKHAATEGNEGTLLDKLVRNFKTQKCVFTV